MDIRPGRYRLVHRWVHMGFLPYGLNVQSGCAKLAVVSWRGVLGRRAQVRGSCLLEASSKSIFNKKLLPHFRKPAGWDQPPWWKFLRWNCPRYSKNYSNGVHFLIHFLNVSVFPKHQDYHSSSSQSDLPFYDHSFLSQSGLPLVDSPDAMDLHHMERHYFYKRAKLRIFFGIMDSGWRRAC